MDLHKVTRIQYSKCGRPEDFPLEEQTETTNRVIIPTTVPNNIRALDVSDLSEDERSDVAVYYDEYSSYLKTHMKTAFSFEDWLSHAKGIDFKPTWRTFKPGQTTILD